jgi:hypothetical protein
MRMRVRSREKKGKMFKTAPSIRSENYDYENDVYLEEREEMPGPG